MSTKKSIQEETDVNILEPSEYDVFILNDDYTPMDFVVDVLIKIFHKDLESANAIALFIHQKGSGLCGTFSHEIAETKVMQVKRHAREHDYPLISVFKEVE